MEEEVAIAPDQLSPPAEAAGPRLLFGRTPPLAILIAILVVAVLAESVLVFRGNSNEHVRDDVLDTSRRFVAILTTYNSSTLDAQRRRVLALATGRFRGEYEQLTGSGFVATLKEREADSRGSVVRIAVSQVRGDDATVLAIVRVTTTNKDLKTPRSEQNVLELSLVRTSSGWKIDSVTILGTLGA